MRNLTSIVAVLLALALAPLAASAQSYRTGLEDSPQAQLQASADAGDRTAEFELGRRFYYQRSVKDDAKALHWFELAAQQGVPWAEYETATMYINGEGAQADAVKAMTWYRAAARDGILVANYDIGYMYLTGEAVARDPAESARWLKIAADGGEPRAQYFLGLMYRDGTGVPQDYPQALKLLRAAAAQRVAPAAYALGDMIKQGKGVEKNLVLGQAWRIMGKYLEAPAQPDGRHIVGAYLVSPDLTQEQNRQAQEAYIRLMKELGFSEN